MGPLIKNSFYLLDACLLFIPTPAYINSLRECARVCLQGVGDACTRVECFVLLEIPF